MKTTKTATIIVKNEVTVRNNNETVAFFSNVPEAIAFAKQFNKPIIVKDMMLEITYKA